MLDGLCQTLARIAALSPTLSKRLSAGSQPAAVAAAEVTHLLNDSIGQARDLARGLSPLGLQESGLQAALEILALAGRDGLDLVKEMRRRSRRWCASATASWRSFA